MLDPKYEKAATQLAQGDPPLSIGDPPLSTAKVSKLINVESHHL